MKISPDSIDISNDMLVAALASDNVGLLVYNKVLRADRALVMAAWIVAMFDDSGGEDFNVLLKRVQNT